MAPIRFLLISPTAPAWRVLTPGQRPPGQRAFRFSMLPSLYVAAAMPADVQTRILDEDVEPIDFDADVDLVGITLMTFNAPRAYEVADAFRARGVPVILGGYHPSFMPEEAAQHADAVCIGEAEANVPQMVEDFRNGRLQQFYRGPPVDLRGLPVPDRSLIKRSAYITPDVVQATRGCPMHCGYCSITAFHHGRFRTRPVEEVIAELHQVGRDLLFMDDNLIADRHFAKELFKRMIPLKKRWVSQCSVHIAADEELLQLAARSGCRGLFIGLESISQGNLDAVGKRFNRARDYGRVVQRLHDEGIAVCAAFVFGMDEDQPDVFQQTLRFLLDARVDALQATNLTPFPGTPLYDQMQREGRITDQDWAHYDFTQVVFQPRHMSAADLQAGTDWVRDSFYARPAVWRRARQGLGYLSPFTVFRVVLPVNLAYRRRFAMGAAPLPSPPLVGSAAA